MGGPHGRSGQVRKISPTSEFDSRTVQPVASRYTDWATGPTNNTKKKGGKKKPNSYYSVFRINSETETSWMWNALHSLPHFSSRFFKHIVW
jgi:hypothetical protein